MITLSNNSKGLALLHQVEEIYGKVYTSDSLLETVLYWGINCIPKSGSGQNKPRPSMMDSSFIAALIC